MRQVLRFTVAYFVVIAAVMVGAQQYTGRVDVEAVVLPVTVRNSRGRVVDDVSASKFRLMVDGLPVNIRDLTREADLPLSLALVLDTSGSMAGSKLRGCRDLMRAFLDERRSDDQLALWTFGDERVLERFPFGMSWYLLPRVIETIEPWSTTALYDMIQRVPDVMVRAKHPRSAAILLTDGVDNASKMPPGQAAKIAESLRTPIYALGVDPPPSPAGDEGPSYEEVLQLISKASGGYYRRIPRLEHMPDVTKELLRELSTRYILTFETSGLGQHKWRPVEVVVDGYEATTRSGYVGTLP